MLVAMMCVGEMRVAVLGRLVSMPMRVAYPRSHRRVVMLMMKVVYVLVLMLKRIMKVLMLMQLRDMQPYSQRHQ